MPGSMVEGGVGRIESDEFSLAQMVKPHLIKQASANHCFFFYEAIWQSIRLAVEALMG